MAAACPLGIVSPSLAAPPRQRRLRKALQWLIGQRRGEKCGRGGRVRGACPRLEGGPDAAGRVGEVLCRRAQIRCTRWLLSDGRCAVAPDPKRPGRVSTSPSINRSASQYSQCEGKSDAQRTSALREAARVLRRASAAAASRVRSASLSSDRRASGAEDRGERRGGLGAESEEGGWDGQERADLFRGESLCPRRLAAPLSAAQSFAFADTDL